MGDNKVRVGEEMVVVGSKRLLYCTMPLRSYIPPTLAQPPKQCTAVSYTTSKTVLVLIRKQETNIGKQNKQDLPDMESEEEGNTYGIGVFGIT